MKWLKRIALVLAIAGIIYFLIFRPRDAANLVRSGIEGLVFAGQSLITFFTTLFS